jgi:hypothetical protein
VTIKHVELVYLVLKGQSWDGKKERGGASGCEVVEMGWKGVLVTPRDSRLEAHQNGLTLPKGRPRRFNIEVCVGSCYGQTGVLR